MRLLLMFALTIQTSAEHRESELEGGLQKRCPNALYAKHTSQPLHAE